MARRKSRTKTENEAKVSKPIDKEHVRQASAVKESIEQAKKEEKIAVDSLEEVKAVEKKAIDEAKNEKNPGLKVEKENTARQKTVIRIRQEENIKEKKQTVQNRIQQACPWPGKQNQPCPHKKNAKECPWPRFKGCTNR